MPSNPYEPLHRALKTIIKPVFDSLTLGEIQKVNKRLLFKKAFEFAPISIMALKRHITEYYVLTNEIKEDEEYYYSITYSGSDESTI